MGITYPKFDPAWVKRRLKSRKRSLAGIGRGVDKDRTTISRIVSGDLQFPLTLLSAFASAFELPEIEVLTRLGLRLSTKSVPVVSWEQASNSLTGTDIALLGEQADRFVASELVGMFVGLEVRDDAMDRVAAKRSIIVVSVTDKELRDRDLGVFKSEGVLMFRRLRRNAETSWLEGDSYSDRYPPSEAARGDKIEVVGRVVSIPVLASFSGVAEAVQ